MASVRDIPRVWRHVGPLRSLGHLWTRIGEDNVLTWASALAYSWLFALFPFLIFLMALIPYLPIQAKTHAHAYIDQAVRQLPPESAQPIQQQIQDLLSQPRNGLLSIGLLIALWSASGGMSATMAALDQCYDIKKPRTVWTQRLVGIGLTILVILMILLVLVLLPVGGIVNRWLYQKQWIFDPLFWLLSVTRYVLALALMFGVLAIIYHLGPSIRPRWQIITPGAIFSVVVWILLGLGFRWYVDSIAYSSYNKTYGAVGGVVLLLLLFYLDALVLILGAEINAEIDFAVSGHRGQFAPPPES